MTQWTVAHQASLSMGFSRKEYWSGLLCPPPGDFPDPGLEPASLMSSALAKDSSSLAPPGKPNFSLKWKELNANISILVLLLTIVKMC